MNTVSKSPHRLAFIDQLRGWAVIVMIEVHTFNEWLRPDIKATGLWTAITFINGLVAPTFVMLAGFSLGLAAVRKWDDYTRFGLPLWKRVRHLLLILFVGYLLHLPAPSYRFWKYWPVAEKIEEFWAVDVLQLIVVSLLLLHLVILIFRDRKVLLAASLVLGCAAFVLTPWAHATAFFDVLPVQISNYFNKAHHSLFPLFPWSGFVFFGCSLSLLYADWEKRNNGTSFINLLGYSGLILILLALIAHVVPVTIQENYNFWKTSPEFSFLRLGIVMALLSAMAYLERVHSLSFRIATLTGQESFFVYALHLMVLYTHVGSFSLADHFRGQFGYLVCSAAYLAVLVPMLLAGMGWHRFKQASMTAARWSMVSVTVVAVFLFFFFEKGKIVLWILNPDDPFK